MPNKEDSQLKRLGKIIALAKRGEGGEKTTAISMVKAICKRHGLDFDAVMSDVQIKEFELELKAKSDFELAHHIIARYGLVDAEHADVWSRWGRKYIMWETDTEHYFEVVNAYAVLRRAYMKERKRIMNDILLGFAYKHDLFYKLERPDREATDEEIEAGRRAVKLSETMDDVELFKQLKGK